MSWAKPISFLGFIFWLTKWWRREGKVIYLYPVQQGALSTPSSFPSCMQLLCLTFWSGAELIFFWHLWLLEWAVVIALGVLWESSQDWSSSGKTKYVRFNSLWTNSKMVRTSFPKPQKRDMHVYVSVHKKYNSSVNEDNYNVFESSYPQE